MCGIMGYVGDKETQRVLTEGLRKLEYRGYDSVGIALNNGETLQHEKSKGRLEVLEEKLEGAPLSGSIGIGHTRWATHGRPSDENSHPHLDEKSKFAVVHNGIIENYMEMKRELKEEGYTFTSETDSEVIPTYSLIYTMEKWYRPSRKWWIDWRVPMRLGLFLNMIRNVYMPFVKPAPLLSDLERENP